MQLNHAVTISFTHLSYCGCTKNKMVLAQQPRAYAEDDDGDCANVDAGQKKRKLHQ